MRGSYTDSSRIKKRSKVRRRSRSILLKMMMRMKKKMRSWKSLLKRK